MDESEPPAAGRPSESAMEGCIGGVCAGTQDCFSRTIASDGFDTDDVTFPNEP